MDSSDISGFADVEQGKETSTQTRRLYELVLRVVNEGVAICPFSMTHLGEALSRAQDDASAVYNRAEVLEKLSRGWSYPDLKQLFLSDFLRCVEKRHRHRLRSGDLLRLKPNWSWVPSFSSIFGEQSRQLSGRFREQIGKEGITSTRSQRRQWRAQLFSNPTLFDQEALVAGLIQDFGYDFKFLHHPDFIPAALGQCSPNRLDRAIAEELGRPTTIVRAKIRGAALADMAYKPIADFQHVLIDSIRSLQDQLAPLAREMEKSDRKALRESFLDLKLDVCVRIGPEQRKALLDRHFSKSPPDELDLDSKHGPHDVFLSKLAANYALDHILDPTSARSQRSSDAGDIFNALYAMHSTVWFGDRYSVPLVKKCYQGDALITRNRSDIVERLNRHMS